jgi:hypothetical protein
VNYNPAPDVPRTFTINQADQTITFAALPDVTFGAPDFTVSATATSGLTVAFAAGAGSQCTIVGGTTVHITGGGSCTVTASQAGDANYNAAPDVPRTFTIHAADQSIGFAAIPDQVFGSPDFQIYPVATSRLPVTVTVTAGACTLDSSLAPAMVHLPTSGLGSCTITASQAGTADFNAAPSVSQSFDIVNATGGTIEGAGLKVANGGKADFHVDFDGHGPHGNLNYDGPPPPPGPGPKPPKLHFEAKTITAIGIAPDGKSAWFAGVGKDGSPFTVYVEDNTSKPGPPKPTADVFKLWINGVLQTGDGSLAQGKVTIKLPKAH